MKKLMQNAQFRTRFAKVAMSPSDVEAQMTFSLLALAVRLYVKMRGVPPSFVTATEILLYLEGQIDDEKAALWKRTYRDGADSGKAREELEQAILAHEPDEILREKLHAFVATLPGRDSMVDEKKLQIRAVVDLSKRNLGLLGGVERVIELDTEIEASRPKCTGVAAVWCPVCGECSCDRARAETSGYEEGVDDGCPLHGGQSKHADSEMDYALSERLVQAARRVVETGGKPRCMRCQAKWEDASTPCVEGGESWSPLFHEWSLEVPFDLDRRGA